MEALPYVTMYGSTKIFYLRRIVCCRASPTVQLALRVQLYTCTGRATKIFDFFRMNEDTSPTYTTTVLYVYYKRNYEHVCSYESCYEYVALYSKYMYVQLYTYC